MQESQNYKPGWGVLRASRLIGEKSHYLLFDGKVLLCFKRLKKIAIQMQVGELA